MPLSQAICQSIHVSQPVFNARKKLLHLKCPLPTPAPTIITIQYPKPLRAILSPEPDSAHHRHISAVHALPMGVVKKERDHPVINIAISQDETQQVKKKRKRRRGS
jgi:hypothetical protein